MNEPNTLPIKSAAPIGIGRDDWFGVLSDDFRKRVSEMPVEELRSRIINHASHISAYQKCLDGLGLKTPGCIESHRRPDDIRRIVEGLIRTQDCNLRGEIIRELRKDKQRLDAAEQHQVNMEIVENCAGNIERYMVALNRHNLDKLICERVAEPANS